MHYVHMRARFNLDFQSWAAESWVVGRAELFQSIFFAAPVSDERLCDVSIMILAGCLTPDIDWLRQGGPASPRLACLDPPALPARCSSSRKHLLLLLSKCPPSSISLNLLLRYVKISWNCGVFWIFYMIYNSYLIEYDLPATNSDVHGTVHLQI